MEAAFGSNGTLFLRDTAGKICTVDDRDARYYAIMESMRERVIRKKPAIAYLEHERYELAQSGNSSTHYDKGWVPGPNANWQRKSPDELAGELAPHMKPKAETQRPAANDELKSSGKTTQLAPAAPASSPAAPAHTPPAEAASNKFAPATMRGHAQKLKHPDELARTLPKKANPAAPSPVAQTAAPPAQPQAAAPAAQSAQPTAPQNRISSEEARQLLDNFIAQSQKDQETGLPLVVKGVVQQIKRMNPGADENHLTSVAQLALVEAAQKVERGREAEFPGLAKAAISNALTKDYEANMAQKRGAGKVQQYPDQFDQAEPQSSMSNAIDIHDAVAKLSPEQQIIASGIMEGKTTQEIATDLGGWSNASVSREREKVMDALRSLMTGYQRQGGNSSTRYERPADKPYKFSSTQLNITSGKSSRAIRAMSDSIPDSDLSEEGREDKPHITVKYGLHTDKASKVEKIIRGFGPIKVKFGTTKIFAAKEDDDDAQDVVYVSVESEKLHELNQLISDELECTDKHPSYVPHVCLAYTKPGKGQKYVGMIAVDGQEMTFDELQFSNVEKEKTIISLKKSDRYEYGPRHSPPKRLDGAVARLHALSEYAEEIDDEALEDEVTGIAREFSADDLKTIARKFGIKRGISTKAKTLSALLEKVCEGCAA